MWADEAPDRALFISNATGTFEIYAWDRATGAQRQATDRPNGTTDGVLTPDGAAIWWFSDTDGDEFGVWMRQPFGGGADEPAAPGLEPSYPAGLALARDGSAVIGRSTDEEGRRCTSYGRAASRGRDLPAPESAGVGDLSHDGTLSRSSTPSTATRCTPRCASCVRTAAPWPSWTTPRAAPRNWA